MRIAICENSAVERERLAQMLTDYFESVWIRYDISPYKWGTHLIEDVEEGEHYDVIFLSIYLHDRPGIEVAHSLRRLRYEGKIIFLAASVRYAVESYEVEASDYLLKPIDRDRLNRTMDRIVRHCTEEMYQFQQRKMIIRVPYKEILYIESSNSKCILHRRGGALYTLYKRLNDIQTELQDERFLRCHQSYLVNMDYIQKADREFELITGDIVGIRQRDLNNIRKKFLAYCNVRSDGDIRIVENG